MHHGRGNTLRRIPLRQRSDYKHLCFYVIALVAIFSLASCTQHNNATSIISKNSTEKSRLAKGIQDSIDSKCFVGELVKNKSVDLFNPQNYCVENTYFEGVIHRLSGINL